MKIVHIVASIDDEAAGPSVSAPRLAEAQARAGAAAELATVGDGDRGETFRVPHVRHRQSFRRTPLLSRLAMSEAMRRSFRSRAQEVDIFHTHGLWLMPNVYPAAAARRGPTAFVISPRGMLGNAALAFSARKKRLFWALLQKRAAETAVLFHATSPEEVEDIRAYGITAPVVIAPNGVDIPDAAPRSSRGGPRTILSLGRIHPKKGLDRLVRAWAKVEKDAPDWRLRIVGPSELGHAEQLRTLAAELHADRVAIEGPIFGSEKLAAYREAELFVLPTLHDNFAMTVAESLAAGTPVISTKGAPWSRLPREGCGWWVDHGAEPLAAAIREALLLAPGRLEEMGAMGRVWMQREFSWDSAAKPVLEAYRWIRRGGEPPASVCIDRDSRH